MHILKQLTWSLLLFAAVTAYARDLSTLQVHNETYVDLDLPSIASTMAAKYHVIIGVSGVLASTADAGNAMRQTRIVMPVGTMEEFLDELVASVPGYQWDQDINGNVHITFGGESSLLDITVESISLSNATRNSSFQLLQRNQQVQSWLRQNKCTLSESATNDDGKTYNIEMTQFSFGSDLDSLVYLQHSYYWSLFEDRSSQCRITIKM